MTLVEEILSRDRPRFFDQVGHQTTNASIENKHFFTKQGHCPSWSPNHKFFTEFFLERFDQF